MTAGPGVWNRRSEPSAWWWPEGVGISTAAVRVRRVGAANRHRNCPSPCPAAATLFMGHPDPSNAAPPPLVWNPALVAVGSGGATYHHVWVLCFFCVASFHLLIAVFLQIDLFRLLFDYCFSCSYALFLFFWRCDWIFTRSIWRGFRMPSSPDRSAAQFGLPCISFSSPSSFYTLWYGCARDDLRNWWILDECAGAQAWWYALPKRSSEARRPH